MDIISTTFAGIFAMLALGGSIDQTDSKSTKITLPDRQTSTYTMPSIAGTWQLQLAKTDPKQPNCQERYNFARDNVFIGASGQEFSYGKYRYIDLPDSLPILLVQTTYDNNQTDCSGVRIDQSGELLVSYIKQQGNTMYWCADKQGKRCPMKLQRVLP